MSAWRKLRIVGTNLTQHTKILDAETGEDLGICVVRIDWIADANGKGENIVRLELEPRMVTIDITGDPGIPR